MCGRFACALGVNDLCGAVACKSKETRCYVKAVVQQSNFDDQFTPSYNVAPTATVPVLISSEHKNLNVPDDKAERILALMRFGIIPTWLKKPSDKINNLETHLCRMERIRESKLYNPLLKKGNRCVVPCIGYYEWQSTKSINKQPYFFYNKKNSTENLTETHGVFNFERGWNGMKLLYLAAIYNSYTDKDGQKKYSFAIVTRQTTPEWSWVHDRMPVVFQSKEDVDKWIKVQSYSFNSVFDLLKKPINNLAAHPVDRTVVNNTRNNIPKCIEPFDLNKPSNNIMRNWLEQSPEKAATGPKCEKKINDQFSIKKWLQKTDTQNSGNKNKTSQKRTMLDDWVISTPKRERKN